jgi:hypothetical protein
MSFGILAWWTRTTERTPGRRCLARYFGGIACAQAKTLSERLYRRDRLPCKQAVEHVVSRLWLYLPISRSRFLLVSLENKQTP